MSIKDLTELLGGELAVDEGYVVDHLDYGYVRECSNMKELSVMLKVLRSGREGHWPDLEKAVENRMHQLDPSYTTTEMKEKLLRESEDSVTQDLMNWTKELHMNDTKIRTHQRGTIKAPSTIKQSKIVQDKRGFDATIINGSRISTNIAVDERMTPEERMHLAEKEKIKGNDAFKCSDFQEAIDYYTRSLKIMERAVVYNNRALTYLKIKQNTQAEMDTTQALSLGDLEESTKFKAYLRRAQARFNMARYQEALGDLENAKTLNQDSKELTSLIIKTLEKLGQESTSSKPKRLQIEEVEETPVIAAAAEETIATKSTEEKTILTEEMGDAVDIEFVSDDEEEVGEAVDIEIIEEEVVDQPITNIAPRHLTLSKASSSAEFESRIKALRRSPERIVEYVDLHSNEELVRFMSSMMDASLFEVAVEGLLSVQDEQKTSQVLQSLRSTKKTQVMFSMLDTRTLARIKQM